MSPTMAAGLGILTAVLALAPGLLLALAPPRTRVATSLRSVCAAALVMLLWRVGAWAFVSVHLRDVAVGVLLVGALVGAARHLRSPAREPGWIPLYAVLAVVLFGLDGWAFSASWYSDAPIEARLPLGPGTFSVIQGGNSALTNPFHGKARELAAIDIVKLAGSGNRATRLVPRTLADYASFGAEVTSPCDGEVIAAVDAYPDAPLGVPDEAHPAGNHVVVQCTGGIVKLAHLRRGSVRVAVGERIAGGQPVAGIGNSGGTSEPHLHIGAFPSGTPPDVVVAHSGDMPVRFEGRYLVANTVFTVP